MAVMSDGYVFEGYIFVCFVQQFLENLLVGVIGLSVLGMLAGSFGMEMGDRFMFYQVWLLKKDGLVEVFVLVDSCDQ